MTKNVVYNKDCLPAMKQMADNQFDLAIVDPPYGKEYARGESGWGVCDNRPKLTDVKWDKATPSKEYFSELQRISKNQIICGGNYFTDKTRPSNSWIVWNKVGQTENKSVFADCELLWTSFNKVIKMFTLRTMGFINDTKDKTRIHPTQKPTELYKWLLKNYAKPNDTILDTHAGSMSSVIACIDMGFSITAYEIDKDYFNAGKKRVLDYIGQLDAFRKDVDIEFLDTQTNCR